jgi:hypothetical protein
MTCVETNGLYDWARCTTGNAKEKGNGLLLGYSTRFHRLRGLLHLADFNGEVLRLVFDLVVLQAQMASLNGSRLLKSCANDLGRKTYMKNMIRKLVKRVQMWRELNRYIEIFNAVTESERQQLLRVTKVA